MVRPRNNLPPESQPWARSVETDLRQMQRDTGTGGQKTNNAFKAINSTTDQVVVVQEIAQSKSRIIFSEDIASGTDYSDGDVWYQRVAGIILAQWEFASGVWVPSTLDSAIVASLDASKITTGTLSAGTTITAGDPDGSRIEIDAAGLRKYAVDGTTVQVDLSGDVAAFSGLITGSEIIAGTIGAARLELDANGLRQYAADGTTVLLDTADDATIRSRGRNTAFGVQTQQLLTTGDFNVAVGSYAQQYLTEGNFNTAVGEGAQKNLTTGYSNTAIGTTTQSALTTGTQNTSVGANSQHGLTTGDTNTAVGSYAQFVLTTGVENTAIGPYTQLALTTGNTNTAVGGYAQYQLTTGYSNTAIGNLSQTSLTTGYSNTAIGPYAQSSPRGVAANATTTASYQTSVGPETGQSSATQVDGITTIGYQATAGAANATSIGREARADHAGSIALGYQTTTTQTNQVMVGPRDVEITDATKGIVLVSPNATRYRITSANGGGLLVNGIAVGGIGAWTAYTPTLQGISGSTWALGTGGVNDCVWRSEGDLMRVQWRFKLGTGFTFPSDPCFSLPFTAKTLAHPFMVYSGVGSARDVTSTGRQDMVHVVAANTSTTLGLIVAGISPMGTPAINATSPWTWAATHTLQGEFTYRVA